MWVILYSMHKGKKLIFFLLNFSKNTLSFLETMLPLGCAFLTYNSVLVDQPTVHIGEVSSGATPSS